MGLWGYVSLPEGIPFYPMISITLRNETTNLIMSITLLNHINDHILKRILFPSLPVISQLPQFLGHWGTGWPKPPVQVIPEMFNKNRFCLMGFLRKIHGKYRNKQYIYMFRTLTLCKSVFLTLDFRDMFCLQFYTILHVSCLESFRA